MLVEDKTLIGKLGLTKDQVIQIIDEWNEHFAFKPREIEIKEGLNRWGEKKLIIKVEKTEYLENRGSHYLEFEME
jgi:hypothetical protein